MSAHFKTGPNETVRIGETRRGAAAAAASDQVKKPTDKLETRPFLVTEFRKPGSA